MANENNNIQATTDDSQIVLYQPDESISLQVKIEEDTVWLTQAQMVELFGSSKANISEHITNIYQQGELMQSATVRKFRTVRKEGNRMVTRNMDYYNLDMIISVGFRVNSHQGIRFRQWANNVLKEYLLRGYAVHQQMLQMEQRIDSKLMLQHDRLFPDNHIDIRKWSNESHDRWLIIDNSLYHCGHSLNANGGHKISAITLMGTSPEVILSKVE